MAKKYAYGPTKFRVPAAWWNKMYAQAKQGYKKLPGMTDKEYSAQLSQIVGGIWAKFSQSTREKILRKYEPMAAKGKALNPGMQWHEEQVRKIAKRPESKGGFGYGGQEKKDRASEHWISAAYSRDMGIPNPPPRLGHCPLHPQARILIFKGQKRVRCELGSHWLNVP